MNIVFKVTLQQKTMGLPEESKGNSLIDFIVINCYECWLTWLLIRFLFILTSYTKVKLHLT